MKNAAYIIFLLTAISCQLKDHSKNETAVDSTAHYYTENHRPQLHFSPEEHWMNDPNGMVFYKGEYHLFYQYFPEGVVWGPMHWGHTVSTDLVHWTHLPIALYPDSLGYIFSGSAVADVNNTSGFGSTDNPPLVTIFTYHAPEKEKAGRTDYQNQGIAYSTDKGRSWTKYKNNPVLKNQGIKDFRDPKVFWYEASKKWVMILAVKDHIELWSSTNLKAWSKLSDFGSGYGAHGGVWECPDLFELKVEGEAQTRWVMIVSINPGGPNGGSGTQYFTGRFDGVTFVADQDQDTHQALWLDYGPDDYAGVTWSNIPDGRKIFLGWMSNWGYAQEVPTTNWRSALTLPRDLSLVKINNHYHLKSDFLHEVLKLADDSKTVPDLLVKDSTSLMPDGEDNISLSMITASLEAKDFSFQFSNSIHQKLRIGYDASENVFYIDRGASGKNNFSKNFIAKATAPRISTAKNITVTIVVDVASAEIFFDNGLTVMTAIYFPDEVLSQVKLKAPKPIQASSIVIRKMKSVWK